MDNKELIAVEEKTALDAFTSENGLTEIIKRARQTVDEFEHDTSTVAGRRRTASLSRRVGSLSVRLDGLRKGLVSEWKAKAKKVDANGRKMRDSLALIKADARRPLTEWENAEQLRIDNINASIGRIARLCEPDGYHLDLPTLEERLKEAQAQTIDDQYCEFKEAALTAKSAVINQLLPMIESEKNRLEIMRLQKENLERAKKAHEEKIAKEKHENEEKLKREAAQNARAKEQQAQLVADREKNAEIQREKDARIIAEQKAEQAEIDRRCAEELSKRNARLEAEHAVREEKRKQAELENLKITEQAAREANKKHADKINKEAWDCMYGSIRIYFPEDDPEVLELLNDVIDTLLDDIKQGKIKHVKINY